MGGYVLPETMSSGRCLHKNMFYWKTCLIAGHVLQDNMSYERTCLTGDVSYREGMS